MLIHNKLAQHVHARIAHAPGAPVMGRTDEELGRGEGVIHWARQYDKYFGWLTSLTDHAVIALAAVGPGDIVLDLGSGPGRLTLAAARAAGPTGQAHGVDASPEMVVLAQRKAARAGRRATFHHASAASLPFADASIDVIMSRLVLHHLSRSARQASLAEVRRALKPGGRCVLVDMRGPALDEAEHHLRDLGFTQVERAALWFPGLQYVRATRPAGPPTGGAPA